MVKRLSILLFVLFQLTIAQDLIAKEKVSYTDLLSAIKKHEKDNPTKDYYYLAGLESISYGMYKSQVIEVLKSTEQPWSSPESHYLLINKPKNLHTGKEMEVQLKIILEDSQVKHLVTHYLNPEKVKLDLE